jgi:hypothetical protein
LNELQKAQEQLTKNDQSSWYYLRISLGRRRQR